MCLEEEHRDHDWNTLFTAANTKRKILDIFIEKIENDYVRILDEKIHNARREIKENEKRCDTEMSRLCETRDKIAELINTCELRKKQETAMIDNLKKKNSDVRKAKSNLEEKKTNILMRVNSLKTISSALSDIVLINTHRELMKLISCNDSNNEISLYSLRHIKGPVNSDSLNDMTGQLFDSEEITVAEINSFQLHDRPILILKGVIQDEETCVVKNEEGLY